MSGTEHRSLSDEREMWTEPFEEVAVDLIGPWKIKLNKEEYEFNALTSIDTVTNLVEIVRINRKTSQHIRDKCAQSWLARYPWPKRCVHDNGGGDFTGWELQRRLEKTNIKDVPTSSHNLTANSICERMHQTVGNILRTLLRSHPVPQNDVDRETHANELMGKALSTAMHVMRSSVHTTLGTTPGALAFSRDMFLNVPLEADWQAISSKREQLIHANLKRTNKRRRQFDNVVGKKVYKKILDPTKLGERTEGPYTIKQVHVNGTKMLQIRPTVTKRINIR